MSLIKGSTKLPRVLLESIEDTCNSIDTWVQFYNIYGSNMAVIKRNGFKGIKHLSSIKLCVNEFVLAHLWNLEKLRINGQLVLWAISFLYSQTAKNNLLNVKSEII